MPELPEVEVVRAGLAPAVSGAFVTGVSVLDERALTRHAGAAAEFEAALTGRTLTSAVRRGKFLWIPIAETETAVVGHLGMSGQLLLRSPGAAPERHERVRIELEHPQHGELAVVFADQR
ncbi:MAG: DNA-formamidopyrimidine glycosylase, partial [Microbacterium sp.]|nr:DNA-formamidopyrimidine glycosylase [Microbacterium sp.]